jgi:hypothetical protein
VITEPEERDYDEEEDKELVPIIQKTNTQGKVSILFADSERAGVGDDGGSWHDSIVCDVHHSEDCYAGKRNKLKWRGIVKCVLGNR